MSDEWTYAPSTVEPPSKGTDPDTDKNWKSYIDKTLAFLSENGSRPVSMSHKVEKAIVPIQGAQPSDWRLEQTYTQDVPFAEISTFSRQYASITYQRFLRVQFDFTVEGANIFLHSEFYVTRGTPRTFTDQRVYVSRYTGWEAEGHRHREHTPGWDGVHPPEDASIPELDGDLD